MLMPQDMEMIKTCVKSVFEEDIVPSLTKVFATKTDLKQELRLEFEKYDRKMDVRFGRLEKRMDHIEETMDQRFAQIDERFAQIDQRFAQIDERFAQIDERFAQIDRRFDDVNDRMQEIRSTLDSVHLKLDEHIEDTSSKFTAHLHKIHELQGIPVSDKSQIAYVTSTTKPKPKPKKV